MLDAEEARAQRYGAVPSVVVVDIDDLKVANDSLGHSAGDDLIKRTATVLARSMRASDYAARLGGDEFGAIWIDGANGVSGPGEARLRHAFAAEGIYASVGSARRRPPASLREAWEQADEAMYNEKRARHVGR